MAFTFDSTVGGATANSYVAVTAADDYFTAHLEGSFWTALSTAQKQAALVQATNRLDMEVYAGLPTDVTTPQRLQFPRKYMMSRDIYFNDAATATRTVTITYTMGNSYLPDDAIPKELADATCEQALYYIKQVAGEFSVDDNDLETLTGYKLGPMDFKIKDGIKGDRLPTKVKNLLSAIGTDVWTNGGGKLEYFR